MVGVFVSIRGGVVSLQHQKVSRRADLAEPLYSCNISPPGVSCTEVCAASHSITFGGKTNEEPQFCEECDINSGALPNQVLRL